MDKRKRQTVQQVIWRMTGQSLTFKIPDNDDVVPVRARHGYFIVHRPLKGTANVPRNFWCVSHELSGSRACAVYLLADAERIAASFNDLPVDWTTTTPMVSSDVRRTARELIATAKGVE